jgi:hypothetical protein
MEQSKMAHPTTTASRSLKPRTFTMQQVEEASGMQAGFCLACGAMQECCEPDARKYRCDNCGKSEVYGAEELLLMGRVN